MDNSIWNQKLKLSEKINSTTNPQEKAELQKQWNELDKSENALSANAIGSNNLPTHYDPKPSFILSSISFIIALALLAYLTHGFTNWSENGRAAALWILGLPIFATLFIGGSIMIVSGLYWIHQQIKGEAK
jgi:hypothetical protein